MMETQILRPGSRDEHWEIGLLRKKFAMSPMVWCGRQACFDGDAMLKGLDTGPQNGTGKE